MGDRETLRDTGWRRMFIVSPERLEEVRELYESIGYEVKAVRPRREEFRDECGECALKICNECWVIYVRRR